MPRPHQIRRTTFGRCARASDRWLRTGYHEWLVGSSPLTPNTASIPIRLSGELEGEDAVGHLARFPIYLAADGEHRVAGRRRAHQ